MLLKADKQGFLIGYSLQGDRAEQLLSDIKSDAGKILALMRKVGDAPALPAVSAPRVRSARPSAAPRMFDAGPSSPREAASSIAREVVAPGGSQATRAAVARAERKASSPEKREARVERIAEQTQVLAREAVSARRQETIESAKQAAASKLRDGRGRFAGSGQSGAPGEGSGGADNPGKPGKKAPGAGGGHGGGEVGIDIKDGLGKALDATQQVDQILGAANEARGLYGNLKGAAVPLGRAGSALLGSIRRPQASKDDKEQTSLLRKLLKQGEKKGAGKDGGGTGGLFSGLTSLIPGLGALVTEAGLITGSAAVGASLTALAGAGMRMLVKNLPLIGTLLTAWQAKSEIDEDEKNPDLTPAEKQRRHAESVGGAAGTFAGALAGGAFGFALGGPVGALVGAGLGGWGGAKAGRTDGANLWGKFNDSKGDIASASAAAGVDPGLVAKVAAFESGFDPTAKNPYSSAHGLGQFTDATWADSVRKWGGKYGVAGAGSFSDAQTMQLRQDPHLQAQMLAELTAQNVKVGRGIGGPDDAANVYALHNLGQSGGSNFLRALQANPSAAVGSLLDQKVISGNPSLYGDGSIPLSESYKRMGGFMNAGAPYAAAMQTAGAYGALPSMPGLPSTPAISAPGAAPQIDMSQFGRVNSGPMQHGAPAPSPPAGQEVRDRSIAHIASGGIGLPTSQR